MYATVSASKASASGSGQNALPAPVAPCATSPRRSAFADEAAGVPVPNVQPLLPLPLLKRTRTR